MRVGANDGGMSGLMTAEQVRLILLAKCAGNQKAWAEKNGVSPQYVCDVLMGRREPGESILNALGLRRLVFYTYPHSASIASMCKADDK